MCNTAVLRLTSVTLMAAHPSEQAVIEVLRIVG